MNLVTATNITMVDEMPCMYNTLKTTAVRIQHQVSSSAEPEASADLEVSHRPVQRFQQPKNLTILYIKYCNILNILSQLPVVSGEYENSFAVSETTFLSFRRAWEHLELLHSTGQVNQSGQVVCL